MRRPLPLAVLLVAAMAWPIAAGAQTTGSVTLETSVHRVSIGARVELSGEISPPSAGQSVRVLNGTGQAVGTATTDAGGRFSVSVQPQRTDAYHAEWNGAASGEVTVSVRAVVAVRMSEIRLFGRVSIRGSVRPARPGEPVDVALVQGGRVLQERRVAMGSAGGFHATFRTTQPGTYRARASFAAEDLVGDVDVTDPQATAMPSLHVGSRGAPVRALEARLVELHYRLVGATDGLYDSRTGDAVIAFHKVQGMSRTSSVDTATWRALADPRTPRPRRTWHDFHFEVDQTRQVLYAVSEGEIIDILHVSTGKPSTPTRDGLFHVVRKIAGFSPNHLYYPSFFDGNRALHGWTDVPTYAASHGCVRIPYWNALWVYGLADYGTRVVVYH